MRSPTRAPVNPNDPKTPVTVSNDALPDAADQRRGVEHGLIVNNVVYAGGSFTNARPAGSAAGRNTAARSNLMAFNVTTGALMTNFTPTFNGQIRSLAVSPDQTAPLRRLVSSPPSTARRGNVWLRSA